MSAKTFDKFLEELSNANELPNGLDKVGWILISRFAEYLEEIGQMRIDLKNRELRRENRKLKDDLKYLNSIDMLNLTSLTPKE